MTKTNEVFTLYTDATGASLHLAKNEAGRWQCVELANTQADLARLLAIVADAREPDYSEIEAIARRNGFAFGDNGEVIRSDSRS